jgi:asparaginyl-tRNA synthetase
VNELTNAETFTSIENLAKKEKAAILRLKTAILKKSVDILVEKGFNWILPVMLAKSTDPLWPDPGAGIEKRIELEIYNEKVRTMQSMIIHKRVLASLGTDKFFILSPNIRIESQNRGSTGKHLYEFTQLDLEIANRKMVDIFRLFEEIIYNSITYVTDYFIDDLKTLDRIIAKPQLPFKVYKRKELEDTYGEEWENILSKKEENPFWVTNIPREFYDFEDEESGEWRNFDLILPEGYGEVISGAEREYEYEKIKSKLERDGLQKDQFQLLLTLAKEGRLKPSVGAGLGIERFIGYVCGAKHVAEVQVFPRIPGIVTEL